MNKIVKLCFLGIAFMMLSCSNEPSLQKYYVNHQNDPNFVVLDVPSSIFLGDNSDLSAETQKALKTIRKANILAYPITEETKEGFPKERETVNNILNQKEYKVLFRMGSSARGIRIMYLGEENAIDEFIVYGVDDEKGFALARILGDDMNPAQLINILKSAEKENIDVNMEAFSGIGDLLKDHDDKATETTEAEEKVEDSTAIEVSF